MKRHRFGAHLALMGLISGVVLPCFMPPRAAGIIATATVVLGGVLFFSARRGR